MKKANVPLHRYTKPAWKGKVRVRISGEEGDVNGFVEPENLEARERQMVASIEATLTTRYFKEKKARHRGCRQTDKVLTTYALVRPDGSPRYLGVLRRELATGEATCIQVVVGQGTGETRLVRMFNLTHGPSVHSVYRQAVDELCTYLSLDRRQKQTLLDAWPAFILRYSDKLLGYPLDLDDSDTSKVRQKHK